jgi:uncharacterized protein YecT (DUF1311 family)
MTRALSLLRHAGLDPASNHPRATALRHVGTRLKAGVTIGSIASLLVATPTFAQTQTQMNAQAGDRLRAADATMTAQWKRTYAYMKRLDAQDTSRGAGVGYASALLESQRAWLRFRDTQCVIEGSEYAGGSMQPMARGNCLTRLTRGRTKQLESLLWKR